MVINPAILGSDERLPSRGCGDLAEWTGHAERAVSPDGLIRRMLWATLLTALIPCPE